MNQLESPAPTLQTWRHAGRAWRTARWLTPRRIDLLLKLRTAAGLPIGRARFRAMELPNDAIEATLRRVRHLADWDIAWTWSAHHFLGEARRLAGDGRDEAAARARRHAALCNHIATFLVFDDAKKTRALRDAATSLFAQTVPTLLPHVERVQLTWRTARLPGYLARPVDTGAVPLVVVLNGATTAKEETILWSRAFLAHGLAVLALDQPGTGEAALSHPLTADCDDLTDGIFALAEADPALDESRVALLGFSLGGALAVRAAAFDRRVAAVVAVTAPYEPATWLPAAHPLLAAQLTALAADQDPRQHIDAFALPGIVQRLRCPLLALGAGHDLILPPGESARLCAEAGDLGTLLWYPTAGHGLYEALDDWTDSAAAWLVAVVGELRPQAPSTQVDLAPAAALPLQTPLPAASAAAHEP